MYNACIVGYGAIGPIHASVISRSDYAGLYAVCDIDSSRRDAAEKCFKVKTFSDFDTALADDNIDVFHICTPHYLHAEMAIKAIEKGRHVILEKPVAITEDELKLLCDCCEKHGSKVGVMLQNRYNNSLQMLKNIISSKEYGEVISVCGSQKWSRTAEYYERDLWRGRLATEGGGLVINQAIHLLDMLGWLCGGITSVKATVTTKHLNDVIEVEDTADAILKFANGVRGTFYATNANCYNEPYMVEIRCESAKFIYTENMLIKIADGRIEQVATDFEIVEGKKYWGSGHGKAILSFYNALGNDTQDYISLNDTLNTMKAVLAVYESSKNLNSEIII